MNNEELKKYINEHSPVCVDREFYAGWIKGVCDCNSHIFSDDNLRKLIAIIDDYVWLQQDGSIRPQQLKETRIEKVLDMFKRNA